MTGKTFRGPTMNWNAVFAGSRCSIAASVAARTGTAFCYATDAASLMRLGGSKMQLIDSNWSSVLPGSTVLTGISFEGRPPPRRVNNANAFASAINVSSTSPPLKLAGLSLLQRNFCPTVFFPCPLQVLDGPTHGGNAHLDALFRFPGLTMLLECGVRPPLQLRVQPGFQWCPFAWGTPRNRLGLHMTLFTSLSDISLDRCF